MKKHRCGVWLWLLLAACAFPANAESKNVEPGGLFVSVLQDPFVLSSREEMDRLISFAEENRIKTLFVQIYRANQAWFPSRVADSSPYEECFKNISDDPLKVFIRKAHKAGLEVHAWLNMLSLAANKDTKFVKKYGSGILIKNPDKEGRALEDYRIDDQYFLDPGDLRVREDLVTLVGEILSAYPGLDGIQFDYIRYPDSDIIAYGDANKARFLETMGINALDQNSIDWKDWKRAQVTGFLEHLVAKTRELRPDIQTSTTACAPYVRAYHEAFQNWPDWLARGLVDFVTLMSYTEDVDEFRKFVNEAKNRVSDFTKVNIAVGAYKLTGSPEKFDEQIKISRDSGGGAIVIFHYGNLGDETGLGKILLSEFNRE